MKNYVGFLSLLLLFFLTIDQASARMQSYGTIRGKGGRFGVGVIVGDPTGVSAKYYTRRNRAFNFDIAFDLNNVDTIHAQLAYVVHPHVLTANGYMRLSWYIGLGPKAIIPENIDDTEWAARFPLGLAAGWRRMPLDSFIEFAPAYQFDDNGGFRHDIAFGARFYF